MLKKIICVFLLAAIILLTACRGQRTVKVNIIYPNEGWYGWMLADNSGNTLNISGLPQIIIPPDPYYFPGGATISQNFDNRTIDLGDSYSRIKIWLIRLTQPGTGSKELGVNIVEEYTAGFLYPATSDILAESSNNTNNIYIPVVLDYEFDDTVK